MQLNTLYLADCIELCSSIPNDFIDLIVTSPPYFVGKEYEKKTSWSEYEHLMSNIYDQAHRILKPGGYFTINFGDFHNSKGRFYECEVTSTQPASPCHFEWGRNQGFDLQATRIWTKHHAKVGLSFVCNKRPRPAFDFEHIWTWRKKGNDGEEWVNKRALSQRGVLGADWKSPAKLERHCASFPVELPDWAIKVYTKDSERQDSIDFDPFVGSGTTIVAAINNGCNFLGCEKDADYCRIASERIKQDTGKEINYEIRKISN